MSLHCEWRVFFQAQPAALSKRRSDDISSTASDAADAADTTPDVVSINSDPKSTPVVENVFYDVFRDALKTPVPMRTGEVRRDVYRCADYDTDDVKMQALCSRFGLKLRGAVGALGDDRDAEFNQALELKVRTGRERAGIENWAKVLHAAWTASAADDELVTLNRELRKREDVAYAAECADMLQRSNVVRRVLVDKARVKLYYGGVYVEQTDLQVHIGGETPGSDGGAASANRFSRWRTVSIECLSAARLERFIQGELAPLMSALRNQGSFYVMV